MIHSQQAQPGEIQLKGEIQLTVLLEGEPKKKGVFFDRTTSQENHDYDLLEQAGRSPNNRL